jgi:hypothetical protein
MVEANRALAVKAEYESAVRRYDEGGDTVLDHSTAHLQISHSLFALSSPNLVDSI